MVTSPSRCLGIVHPRVAILGASGLSEAGLFGHSHTEELALKMALFRIQCETRILPLDRSKLGVADGLCIADLKSLVSTPTASLWSRREKQNAPPGATRKGRQMLGRYFVSGQLPSSKCNPYGLPWIHLAV